MSLEKDCIEGRLTGREKELVKREREREREREEEGIGYHQTERKVY